ncbi:MAG: hypothetical protein ABR958_03825 [Dehalococcoidales bacterium]
MTQEKQVTIGIKELSGRAKVKPQILRRVLRAKFPRAEKGKAYQWQQGDPQIEQILKAIKDNHKPQSEKPKAENKATKKPTKPVTPNGKKATATPSKPEPTKAENQKEKQN